MLLGVKFGQKYNRLLMNRPPENHAGVFYSPLSLQRSVRS